MRTGSRPPAGRSRGFTYLIALFAVALLGAGLATLGQVWHTASVREKEAQLLFVGAAYRTAITSYYQRTPGGVRQYPRSLADLEKDPRFPVTVRHIRKLYPDPLTASSVWGVVLAPDGGIMGVYSTLDAAPMKRAGFDLANRIFEERALLLKDQMTYRDWQFVFPVGAFFDPRLNPGGVLSTSAAKPATP